MEKLPLDITPSILSGLPVVLQLQCRDVCETWRTLLPKPKMGLLFVSRKVQSSCKGARVEFQFSEQNEDKVRANDDDEQLRCFGTLTKFDHSLVIPESVGEGIMVGSCNGLVCYAGNASSSLGSFKMSTQVYICNPLLGEQIQLPIYEMVQLEANVWKDPAIGCGYNRSSNEYKVVRILCNRIRLDGWVQLYVFESGTGWRRKIKSIVDKQLVSHLSVLRFPVGVFAGGALHWIDQDSTPCRIIDFDLEHERFSLLPPIPSDVREANVILMVLGGNLCVLELVPSKHVKVWELIRNKKTVKYTSKKKYVCTWFTIFSLAGEDWRWLMRSDKCSLWYNVIISCYDPETKTLRKLNETLKKLMDPSTPSTYTTSKATPFVNSVVSLKGIMGLEIKEKHTPSR